MRRQNVLFVACALALASGASAAEQIGTITASGPFQLRGAAVPASAAAALPLLNGNEVVTTDSTAIMQLLDSSRVGMGENSQVKVQRVDEGTMVCLEEGAIEFNAAENSRLLVCARGRRLEIQAPAEGMISFGGPQNEVLVNAEEGAVLVRDDITCSCGRERPLLPYVIIGGAAATVVPLATLTGGEPPPLPPLSLSTP